MRHRHSHKCKSCETVWSHTRRARSQEEHDEFHKCPKCGKEEYWIHSYENEELNRRLACETPAHELPSMERMLRVISMMFEALEAEIYADLNEKGRRDGDHRECWVRVLVSDPECSGQSSEDRSASPEGDSRPPAGSV